MIKLGKNHPLVASVSKNNRCGSCKINAADTCTTCPNNYGYYMCKHPYALCTSAKCIHISGTPNSTDAVYKCYCDVDVECSTGTRPCNTLKPFILNGKKYIYSTFNPKQLNQGYSLTTCPSTGRLINCLNKICYVDPQNSSKAYCYCNPQNPDGDYWNTMSKTGEPCSCNNLSGATIPGATNMLSYWKQCKKLKY